MYRRLVPLSSRRTAKHRQGGSCEVVCVSWVEGRAGAPARGAPVVATAHKVCAREFHTRALQRRLTSPPAEVDGSVDGLRRARGGRASPLWGGGIRRQTSRQTEKRTA